MNEHETLFDSELSFDFFRKKFGFFEALILDFAFKALILNNLIKITNLA